MYSVFERKHYTITADDIPGKKFMGWTIVPDDFEIKAYSTDAGKIWKPGNVPDSVFAKQFSKGFELWQSDKFVTIHDEEEVDSVNVIAFPKINKRSKNAKLTVNYLIGADLSGETPGEWVLTEKKGTLPVMVYMIPRGTKAELFRL